MIEKEKLKYYANKLMFDMTENEYETLQKEFEVILKQMNLIGKIPNINKVIPMTFPFKNEDVNLRDDEIGDYLTVGEVLIGDYLTVGEVLENAKHQIDDQVKVPKVVDENV